MDDLIEEAQRLLDSKAYGGNHGFRGIALNVWKYQRDSILEALDRIVKGDIYFEELGPAFYSACPMNISNYVGTEEGRDWVKEAHELIEEIIALWDFDGQRGWVVPRDDEEDE